MLPARRFEPIDPEVLLTKERTPSQQDAVEAQLVESETLREPLARLPADERRALVLTVIYGFTAREISELDGVPLGPQRRGSIRDDEAAFGVEGARWRLRWAANRYGNWRPRSCWVLRGADAMPRCPIELVVTRHDDFLLRRSGSDMRKGTDYRMLPMPQDAEL
jgi:hypothetical protein